MLIFGSLVLFPWVYLSLHNLSSGILAISCGQEYTEERVLRSLLEESDGVISSAETG